MIILNNQCYDGNSWVKWLNVQDELDLKQQKNGDGPLFYDRLRDPISGKDVGNRHSVGYDHLKSLDCDTSRSIIV